MAVVGDVFADIQSVEDDAYLDIRPDSGYEASIQNIYFEGAVEISRYDGTNEIIFHTETEAGCLARYTFRVNNTDRIRIRNVAGSPKLIGYDGIYTKVA